MNMKGLSDKSIVSAQKLYSFLVNLSSQVPLTPEQNQALMQDLRKVEKLILLLNEANSAKDWRDLWTMIVEMKRSFGGYVGDELGQNLVTLLERLWGDIFELYSEAMKSA